ncbi:MAG: hypothetical protein ACJARX_001147 [Psychroserpens sp.]|jgi:hypothetical protein|uniref:hypothetical protein n=1 Tax=Psychroserpens sp. TaxID=2020870 RepID=UPI0039E21D25
MNNIYLRSEENNKVHYEYQLEEFIDKTVFYLRTKINNKACSQSKRQARVTNVHPLAGLKTDEGYQYIEYVLSF